MGLNARRVYDEFGNIFIVGMWKHQVAKIRETCFSPHFFPPALKILNPFFSFKDIYCGQNTKLK